MNYERWGQSLGMDIMPQQPPTMGPFAPPAQSQPTNQSSGQKTVSGPQLISLLPSLIAAGVQRGLVPSQPGSVPSNTPPSEVQCADGYYRDAAGLCQQMIMDGAPPPATLPGPWTPPPGQPLPGQSEAQPVAPLATPSPLMVPILAFVGGVVVGAGAMHLYMKPAKVTSNRGRRRVRRNRRRSRR